MPATHDLEKRRKDDMSPNPCQKLQPKWAAGATKLNATTFSCLKDERTPRLLRMRREKKHQSLPRMKGDGPVGVPITSKNEKAMNRWESRSLPNVKGDGSVGILSTSIK